MVVDKSGSCGISRCRGGEAGGGSRALGADREAIIGIDDVRESGAGGSRRGLTSLSTSMSTKDDGSFTTALRSKKPIDDCDRHSMAGGASCGC
jgi:hypothetical protein